MYINACIYILYKCIYIYVYIYMNVYLNKLLPCYSNFFISIYLEEIGFQINVAGVVRS